MANLIKAAVFTKKKAPSKSLLDSLVVTGGNNKVGEALRDLFKWDGTTPTVCPVFSLAEEDGKITACRWSLHGRLARVVRMRAEDIFESASKELIINIEVEDLAMFEFDRKGSNTSYWVEDKDCKIWVSNKTTKERLTKEEANEGGVKDFCLRAAVAPETPSVALMWLAVVPLGLQDLKSKLPLDHDKNNCPQITLALGGERTRPVRIKIAVEERSTYECGFGCFPFLEWLSSEMAVHPQPEDLRRGVHVFMRSVRGMNNRGAKTILAAMEDPSEVAKEAQLSHIWPEAPAQEQEDSDGRKLFCFIAR